METYYKEIRGSRFMTFSEIEEQFKMQCFDLNNKEAQPGGGMPIFSDGFTYYGLGNDTNTLICSTTGSGKTRRAVLPGIISLAMSLISMIITDPKGELFGEVAPSLRERGYRVLKLDFRKPLYGNRFNLLQSSYRLYRAGEKGAAINSFRKMISSLAKRVESSKDPFWSNSCVDLATGLFCILCEEGTEEECTFESLYELLISGFDRVMGKRKISVYLEHKKNVNHIKRNLFGSTTAASETVASILSCLGAVLSAVCASDDLMQMVSSYSDFSTRQLCEGETPVALFIITEDESGLNSDLLNALIETLYAEMLYLSNENPNGKLNKPFRFILEEFGNQGEWPNITNMLTAARGRNILFSLVIQSYEQLEAIYGAAKAQTIKENCGNLIFFSSPSVRLASELSARCGYFETSDGSRKPLLTSEQIMYQKTGEVLVFAGNNYPITSVLPDWSLYHLEVEEEENVVELSERMTSPVFDFDKAIERVKSLQKVVGKFENEFKPPERPKPAKKASAKASKPELPTPPRDFDKAYEDALTAVESGLFNPDELKELLTEAKQEKEEKE